MDRTQEKADEINSELQQEIEDIKSKQTGDLEIEVTDNQPEVKETPEPKKEAVEPDDKEYGKKVQQRIRKIIAEKKEAEERLEAQNQKNIALEARLLKLEQGSQQQANQSFQQRYEDTKKALLKATEEGDTEAQVNFQEQLADMRAAIRVDEMRKQQQQNMQVSPTVGKAQQTATNPTPKKAMEWWQSNNWFNQRGFERESAMARSIDVQLDLEGHDKESDEYYEMLNSRLQKHFPELISSKSVAESRPRAKSSNPVAPATGGSGYKGNRVRMTADQLRMARELGINDEAGLKKYAAEIQKSQGR